MREWQSLSHVRWYCRYHVVFVPKYRKRSIFGQLRKDIGRILRELCMQHEVELVEGHAMPDHVHLLFQLGNTLTLDRVVAKWRTLVRRAVPGLAWQANFFEHRLRADELSEGYAWYVFMNPYRAGLIGTDSVWPGWWTDGVTSHEFLALARPGPCPQPELLGKVEERTRGLILGE